MFKLVNRERQRIFPTLTVHTQVYVVRVCIEIIQKCLTTSEIAKQKHFAPLWDFNPLTANFAPLTAEKMAMWLSKERTSQKITLFAGFFFEQKRSDWSGLDIADNENSILDLFIDIKMKKYKFRARNR